MKGETGGRTREAQLTKRVCSGLETKRAGQPKWLRYLWILARGREAQAQPLGEMVYGRGQAEKGEETQVLSAAGRTGQPAGMAGEALGFGRSKLGRLCRFIILGTKGHTSKIVKIQVGGWQTLGQTFVIQPSH